MLKQFTTEARRTLRYRVRVPHSGLFCRGGVVQSPHPGKRGPSGAPELGAMKFYAMLSRSAATSCRGSVK